jgi:hypothetical protein
MLTNIRLLTLAIAALYLMPAMAHDSHVHKAPWQACEQKQKSQQCSYHNGAGDLFKGTCQLFSKVLMCARNQPIIYADKLAKQAKQKIIDKASHKSSN